MKRLLLFLFLAGAIFTGFCDDKLIILHTNDTHSQIDPDESGRGGILRRKVVIDSIRQFNKNVILVDAGDAVQGTIYFNLFGGEIEMALMDSLKYDIQILGNHEFDNGIDSIAHFYKKLKSELLSANYDFSKTSLAGYFKPYTIKEFNGKKIAFIGINLNPQGMIVENNYKGLIYENPYNVADSIASELKKAKKADFVIAITHIGYHSSSSEIPEDVKMIEKSHYLDVVIGGHSHTLINPDSEKSVKYLIKNADGKEILIAQAGNGGRYLGEIELDLNDLTVESKLIPVISYSDSKIDRNLERFIAPYKHKVDSLMNNVIAYSDIEMSNGRNDNSYIMNWVADEALQMATTLYGKKIDMAIMNKGGIRKMMPKGEVSEGLISSMFPFDGGIVVAEIRGSDLIDAFKVMAKRRGDALSAGVKVIYGKKNVIKKATLNGKNINPNKYYTIATLEYLANGGDYMVPLTKAKRLMTDTKKFGDRMLENLKTKGSKGININSTNESRMYYDD